MRISDLSSDVCSSDLEDELSLDKWDWIHALETPILDLLESQDTSKPEDLLDSYDKCEVVFLFKRQGYAIDEMISSSKSWSEFSHMHVDHSLQQDRKSTRLNSSH